MTITNQQTLQQKRAAHAWEKVKDVRGDSDKPSEKAKKYGSLVRSLPAMIQSDGLATSLAFLLAKNEEHHKNAYDHVSEWVMGQLDETSKLNLLEWVLENSSTHYRRAASEALAYLNWLKRFAEAEGLTDEP